MSEFLERWMDAFKSAEIDIRERILVMITTLGSLAAIIGIIESALVSKSIYLIIGLSLFVFLNVLCMYITLIQHRRFLAQIITGFVVCGVILPAIFFYKGAVFGGSPVWLILNVLYVFLMFDGIYLYLGVSLCILNDLIDYYIGYFHPELINELPHLEGIYIDSLFAVIVVSLLLGMMIKAYVTAYSDQRKKSEEQKKNLEEASKVQTNFFASMSHELRTPLNSIIGLNEMILRESSESEIVEYAQTVQNSSKMLLSLINDILDMSQLTMKKMEITPIEYDVSPLITETVQMVAALMNEKDLDLILDIDESIPQKLYGDRKRIAQILVNLLSNAVKYTPKGSITFGIHEERVGQNEILLRFVIQDTGIGIKKEDLETLYDSFKRIEMEANEKVQGSGLGLSIVKELVDLMDGNIQVDSIYTKGTTFTVNIRQAIVQDAPIGDMISVIERQQIQVGSYKPLFEAPSAKILVVDDNSSNCSIIKMLLSATKVQVDIAYSGAEALELTKTKIYQVILLDHMMPEMDGIQTLTEIMKQENGLCKDSAIIALTANTMANVDQFYQQKGFDGYLEKPVNGKLLESMILSYMPDALVEVLNTSSEEFESLNIRRMTGKKKRRLIVTTDCLAEIPQNMLDKYNIRLMYLYIKTENGRFADTIEIDTDNLSQYITETEAKAFVDSAEVSELEAFFANSLLEADEIVHITMAKDCGKSFGIATEAAKKFGRVHVVDSGHLSTGQSMVVLYASQLAMKGESAGEIISKVNELKPLIVTQFVMPTALLFSRNGYAGKIVGRVISSFGLHPVVVMKNSRMYLKGVIIGDFEKARLRFVRRAVRKGKKIERSGMFVTHVGLSAREQEKIQQELVRVGEFEKIFFNKASFSAACNTGMGSICLSYAKKNPKVKNTSF